MKKYLAFFTTVLLINFLGILTPTYGQWQKNIIDDNSILTAVSVDVADMVGDSKPDLVVTNWGVGKLLVYQNDFPQWIKHSIGQGAATFAWSGDMDGDDTLDVVANLYTIRKLVWYENNHPTWTQHIIDDATDNPDFILVADFDNDDNLDVVAAGGEIGGAVVWYENNHPNWIKHIIESASDYYPALNVNDFDGDGLLDVAATMVNENKVVWFRNENNGLSWTKYPIDDSLNNAFCLNSYDIDGDDTVDVIATTGGPYFEGSDVVWYENNHPKWTKHIIDTNLPGASWVDVTDIDGNDTMDVIAGGFVDDVVVWYENHHPTWKKDTIATNLVGPRLFAVSDINGDEINEVIVPAYSSVVWYKNPYLTGIENISMPDKSQLQVNQCPNPFSASINIEYELRNPETVTINFYNQFGKQVGQIEENQQKGLNRIVWTPENLADGIYYFRIQAGDQMASGKLVLVR